MNIVILDGEALNPGDLSWAPLEALGNLTVYPRAEALCCLCGQVIFPPIWQN